MGDAVAGAFLPIYAGTVVAGHLVGRWEARRVADGPASDGRPFETALSEPIERLTTAFTSGQATDVADRLLDAEAADDSMIAIAGH